MQSIPDPYYVGEFSATDFRRFATHLQKSMSYTTLLTLMQEKFVIPEHYDCQFMDDILPENLRNHWRFALYDAQSQASNLDRTGSLLLLVILQELGFIEEVIKEIVINADKGIKVYQTDEDVFIEECIEDTELYVDRPIVRVCKDNQEDSQLIQRCYESLRERPESLKRLPQQLLLKLLSIYAEDAFPLIKMLIDQGQDIAEENLRVVQGFLGQLDFLKKKDGGGESILTAALSSGNQQIV
ncbi:hypothetical protein [Piscirickettsia salmonis]|uniref:hypothetical protein n=1 Tax=Piscirickettsia salmonis TaxID=1238 RepID=UPI0012BAFA3A|nr:hypothetical protein [Piscirickettsia salmonis]